MASIYEEAERLKKLKDEVAIKTLIATMGINVGVSPFLEEDPYNKVFGQFAGNIQHPEEFIVKMLLTGTSTNEVFDYSRSQGFRARFGYTFEEIPVGSIIRIIRKNSTISDNFKVIQQTTYGLTIPIIKRYELSNIKN